jgi:serine protease inhibitor
MALANGLWVQKGAPVEAGFLDLLHRHYGTCVNIVDFRHRADDARATINRWVEDKTRRRIRDLIPAGNLNIDTRLVLVNAVYFKGRWMLQFRQAATRHEPFWLNNGETVQVPLMHQQQPFRYLQARGYQAVELDYTAANFRCSFFFPTGRTGFPISR